MPDTSTPHPPAAPTAGPALPSTADTIPYVPVSWLAVGAVTCAALFAVLLLVMGIVAFFARKPLLDVELLFFGLGLAAVVLSFAARRVIRNAEGTRTGVLFGVDLPNAAWWTGLVLSLGYGAYLLAIDFSIRQDAKAEVQRWADLVTKNDLAPAFHRTRDPKERSAIQPNNVEALEGRWGNEFLAFRQCDLVRLASRNAPETCSFAVGGLRRWAMTSTGIECVVAATFKCPEGVFPVQVALQAVDSGPGADGSAGPAGRQWRVVHDANGYVQRDLARNTSYGWLVNKLEGTGGEYGRQFLNTCARSRESRLGAYLEYTSRGNDPFLGPLTIAGLTARLAVVGNTAGHAWLPGPEYYDFTADRLFTLPGGAKPSAEQAKTFRTAWGTVGIVPSGQRLQNSPDQHDQVTFTDSAIEVRVPVEIPLSATKNEITAARGRVVVVCTDPQVLAEVKRLREAAIANPDQGTTTPPDDIRRLPIPWTVLRVESDLQKVTSQVLGPNSGPPRPGMGGPGG